jgi:hypothetical protein
LRATAAEVAAHAADVGSPDGAARLRGRPTSEHAADAAGSPRHRNWKFGSIPLQR